MKKRGLVLVALSFLAVLMLASARAQTVVPADRVTVGVNVRSEPSSESAIVGLLRPGERARWLSSVPSWHEIELAGVRGFVSKSWTVVLEEPVVNVAAFEVHFLDVGTGDSAIIDVGDREAVIDGGDSVKVLHDYAARTGIIDGPIELVVVTHADADHWKGLTRLLGFEEHATEPRGMLEFWEPGYDRLCGQLDSYAAFVLTVQNALVPARFKRPLEEYHPPATTTMQVEPFELPELPGVRFTVLHSENEPGGPNCAFKINNASIVLLVEIAGVRFLFTGDGNGKRREQAATIVPEHVEERLLALEAAHPGTLKADVLKVPHHGSETASTEQFIQAVDPSWVVISASTRHHLPDDTVVERYESPSRQIFRTDRNHPNDRDHIVCRRAAGSATCEFAEQ